jgi:hypothetical protein
MNYRKFIAIVATLIASAVFSVTTALAQGVTFHKDIEPILQRSCQNCHRSGGAGPMALVSYEEVAPFAGLIEYKTGLRDRAGAMPPWYMEKDIGIQHFKSDPSLTDQEIAAISQWARTGAPKGNTADAPAALVFDDGIKWQLGEPDLVVSTTDVTKLSGTPDWWGEVPRVPIGLDEDRYVKSVEIVEVNDVGQGGAGDTVGGLYIFHHMIWSTQILDEEGSNTGVSTNWPVHEVGRNGDIFDPEAGRLLKAGSSFVTDSVHMHSNGRDTVGHLEIGFRFHPEGYEPKFKDAFIGLGNGVDISITGNQTDQELHAYTVLNEHTKVITLSLIFMHRVNECAWKPSGATPWKLYPAWDMIITGYAVIPTTMTMRHCYQKAPSCILSVTSTIPTLIPMCLIHETGKVQATVLSPICLLTWASG